VWRGRPVAASPSPRRDVEGEADPTDPMRRHSRSALLRVDLSPEPVGSGWTSTNARTIAAYEAGADAYQQAEATHNPPALSAFLREVATQLEPGTEVLEFGSATGKDAAALEGYGVRVHRTDATAAFVSRLRARGLRAEVLNALTDEPGGPWSAMYAGAVFLHFDEAEFAHVLVRTAAATVPGGYLAFTLKEGDGAHWTTAKLGQPRHFTYWRR